MSTVLDRRVALIAALTVIGVTTSVAAARPVAEPETALVSARPSAPEAKWLAGLNGDHRQLFDSPDPAGGIPLVHIMNFLDAYNKAFGVSDKKLSTVGTFYGKTTFHGLNDAMWTKYRIADFLKGVGVNDAGATPNPWRTAPTILGMSIAPASIEALQQRGTKFILCNNALGIFSGLLAQAQGLDAKVVNEDMKANILPGVALVPAMVIAIKQAQRAGLAYHRQ
jgi:intracellular sulfur oxidation DsrE/DsrF family protein